MSGSGSKGSVRDAVRARVARLTPRDRERAAEIIAERITGSGWWRDATGVMLFAADATEPDVDALIDAAHAEGKAVAFPSVDWAGKSMRPKRVRSMRDLTEGRHGIRVPGESCPPLDPAGLDAVLVPGVAFDARGGRLGRGGGFYDRFLAAWRDHPVTGRSVRRVAIGVGFAAQVVGRVPSDPHDQRLDGLVTDAGDGAAGGPANTEVRR